MINDFAIELIRSDFNVFCVDSQRANAVKFKLRVHRGLYVGPGGQWNREECGPKLMRYLTKSSYLIIMVISLVGLSCGRLTGRDYDIDKASPNGVYRVKVEVRAEKAKGTRDYTEHGKFQFFKGTEVIRTYEWDESDQYEASFREATPVIEWVNNTVLRMGENRSNQPFSDELIVVNNTGEDLKYLDVSYGKYESFWVFDLEPAGQVALQASPGFKPNGTSNYFMGYGGQTKSGKEFAGTMENKQRKSQADGPLKFQIMISTKDLR